MKENRCETPTASSKTLLKTKINSRKVLELSLRKEIFNKFIIKRNEKFLNYNHKHEVNYCKITKQKFCLLKKNF